MFVRVGVGGGGWGLGWGVCNYGNGQGSLIIKATDISTSLLLIY